MVKFGKNKYKAIHKLAKKQNATTSAAMSNKVIKKKINAEKKVSFQKEVLLKEAAESPLVKNVRKDVLLNELSKKTPKTAKPQQESSLSQKAKLKPVQKQKKRQKTQISDTKLLLNLMKKK